MPRLQAACPDSHTCAPAWLELGFLYPAARAAAVLPPLLTIHTPRSYKFTIHGMWPNYADGTWPQFCDKTQFDESKLDDIMDELKELW